ncbi:MarR family winged helix-turn-helix transcriptional regulator [Saccharopolyspora sp. 5N708]|uniref:MarR family winged helix-turn-helix transcriptional regulator n=1 Tax=Saccharopolyspora sp. 5N708 TaxID=3457424 RepID=UPI003FD0D990
MSDPAPELRLLDALFRLSKSVLADARTHVAAAADLDLADFLALRTVELGVDTPGGLVADLGLNPAVVSRALTKLAKAGLVERRIDPDDSRRSRLALTAQGARTTAAIAARVRPGLAQRLQRLDPDRRQTLVEALEAL